MSPASASDPFASRRGGPACVSDLALDRLALGELDDSAAAAARTHLVTCDACTQAWERIEAAGRQFAAEVDVPTLAARVVALTRPRSLRERLRQRFARATGWAPALAAVAVMSVGLLIARPGDESVQTRSKGNGFGVTAYVSTESGVVPYAGSPLAAGDRVAFHLSSQRAGYVVVVAIDERGTVSRYYPPTDAPERVESGNDVALRTAVELDDAPGRELVIALRCDGPTPPRTAIEAARSAAKDARAAGRPVTEVGDLGLGCVEARITLTKAPAPAHE